MCCRYYIDRDDDEQAQIHNRMPLILPKDRIDEWIRLDAKPEDLLAFALTDMVMERATESTQTPMPRFWHHHK